MKAKEPRVLQLIDSLNAGGAERVSVNLANALFERDVKSFLCATRKSGALEQFINPNVKRLILFKRFSMDPKALYTLVKFIRANDISIIHAHSTSFFMAVLCSPFTGVKIVWHDHYGNAEHLEERQAGILIIFSYFFDFVISVNQKLVEWSKKNLNIVSDKVMYIQNFAQLSTRYTELDLPGTKDTRIVCLANLREQKDHMTLLKAFKEVLVQYSDWHLLLVGRDNEDSYSAVIKKFIVEHNMEHNVHILGSRSDSADILLHATIGVLSSESEGLPIALLEYGLAKLPVICTDVGQCSEVLADGKLGIVIRPKESQTLAKSLEKMIQDETLRSSLASKFYKHVEKNYSQRAVIDRILKIYQSVLHD